MVTDVPTDEGFVVVDGTAAAVVDDNGTLEQHTTDVLSVSHAATGTYCIQLNSTIVAAYATASPRADDSTDGVEVDVIPSASDCPPGDAEINTFQVT